MLRGDWPAVYGKNRVIHNSLFEERNKEMKNKNHNYQEKKKYFVSYDTPRFNYKTAEVLSENQWLKGISSDLILSQFEYGVIGGISAKFAKRVFSSKLNEYYKDGSFKKFSYLLRGGLFYPKNRVNDPWSTSRYVLQCLKKLEKDGITHLIAIGYNSSPVLEYCKNNNIKGIVEQICFPAEFEYNEIQRQFDIYPWLNRDSNQKSAHEFYQKENKKQWDLCEKVLCASPNLAKALLSYGCSKEKISISRYPFNSGLVKEFVKKHRKEEVNSTNPLRILYCGGKVSVSKGSHFFYLIKKEFGDTVEIKLAGSIDLIEKNLTLIDERCTLLGRIDQNEMLRQYEWADVILHPSLFEGSSIAVNEAMSAGMCILASDRSTCHISNGKTGLLFDLNSLNDLFEKIKCTFDSNLREYLGGNALIYSHDFNENIYSKELISSLPM